MLQPQLIAMVLGIGKKPNTTTISIWFQSARRQHKYVILHVDQSLAPQDRSLCNRIVVIEVERNNAPPQPTEKFLGNAPAIFTGDRTKVDSFLTQWELYCSVNANNAAIQNQYQKTMLFLTYIQGDLVRVWVVAACRWLVNEVTNFGVDQYDPYLWESIEGAFRRQFADTLEKERAQMQLRQGFKMKDGNIDEYVTKFDLLVNQAGY